MTELTQYLNAIKQEKETKLIPQNIQAGITILGVQGSCKNFIKADVSKLPGNLAGIITEVNNLDITQYSGNSLYYLFNGLVNLKKISFKNTSKIINMSYLFSNCTTLEEINFQEINTSNVTNMSFMFNKCSSLITIPQFDTRKVTNVYCMFTDCTRLSNESLNNILAMCANAKSITSNKTLKYIGLTSAQATTCQGLSNYQAFLNAGWTTGY